MSPAAAYSGVMTGTREHDGRVTSSAVRRPPLASISRHNTVESAAADVNTPPSDELNGDQQPLFRRRRQLPTSLDYERRLPGYMKPTFGSSQKALFNRSRTLTALTVSSRPQSSPALTLSSSLNLQRSMRIADKSINSTSAVGFRPQQAAAQHAPTRHDLNHRAVHHTHSVPITAGERELPTTYAGGRSAAVMLRPDSSLSKDASESPRSSDMRRRVRRIDVGLLPHSSKPTSRVTAALGRDSPLSAADSVVRPTQSASLAHSAGDTIPSNVDQRPALGLADVTQRVGWSSHDCSDAPSPTVGRDRRQTAGRDSVDSQPPPGGYDEKENADWQTTARASPVTRRDTAGGGPSQRSRPTTGQPLTTQQRRPPTTTTTTRPSTTSRCVAVKTSTALTMPKSVSQPTFLAMLVSGTAVSGRDASPASRARDHVVDHVVDRTPNARRGYNNNNNNVESTSISEEENNNDDDDDDAEEEMKRQRIKDWLQHLETVVLDRPSSPTIDDDVPPQTDTAIHIVYDGD